MSPLSFRAPRRSAAGAPLRCGEARTRPGPRPPGPWTTAAAAAQGGDADRRQPPDRRERGTQTRGSYTR